MSSITLVQYAGLSPKTTISPPCGKVHMALRFKELKYRVRNIKSLGEVKRANPRGRLPALVIDGDTIVDSSDIVSEIEKRFPDPPLEPDDPFERAHVKILEDWADEVLYFYGVYVRWCVPENFERMRREYFSRLQAPLRWFVPALVRRDMTRRSQQQGFGLKGEEAVRRELDECLDAIEVLLHAGPFVVGDQITRADLAIACILDQLLLERLNPDVAAEIRARTELMDWLERVHERAPSAA